jgi:hypothetical protein
MAVSLQSFFESSPLAGRIKLPTRVVVQRTQLSPGELMQIRESGRYGPIPKKQEICELEAGGRVLARGKIVRRRSEYYFKVLESYAGGER